MKVHDNINRSDVLPDNAPVIQLFQELAENLQQTNQRVLVVCQGSRAWCLSLLNGLSLFGKNLLLSEQQDLDQGIPFKKVENLLGLEADCVVYDGYSGIQVDVLCMALGLVTARGILMLLLPEDYSHINDRYGQWQGRRGTSHFIDYLFKQLKQSNAVVWISQDEPIPEAHVLPSSPLTEVIDNLTREQAGLLQVMSAWLVENKKKLFLLTADRGRGKSTALGLFVGQYLHQHKVVITAASKSQAIVLLSVLEKSSGNIQFMAPDEILRCGESLSCLIIDEAAMIPNSMLQQCLELSERVIMATTTGGYEGTGQGFLLKFLARFDQNDYQHETLSEPVRWGKQDLLEPFINDLFLLKSEQAVLLDATSAIQIKAYSKQQLNENYSLLKAVYALMVSAHYRTRPSDLRQLMDDENQRVLVAHQGQQIVAVLLLNLEGGLDADLCSDIFMGRRRPQGHLFAQMLTAQAGIEKFAAYRGYRVQRITVSEKCRRQGIGTDLIETALKMVEDDGLDYLASSFALDHEVTPFWKMMKFQLVHIGSGRGKSTGRQTIAVIRPLNQTLIPIVKILREKIKKYLPIWLLTYCNGMLWQDVKSLLELVAIDYPLTDQELNEIRAFSQGYRGYELTQAVLQKLVISTLSGYCELSDRQQQLLIEKVLLDKSWQEMSPRFQGQGRKALTRQLRELILICNGCRQHAAK